MFCLWIVANFKQHLASKFRDFEDMLQFQCAKAGDCDIIITNNKRDFAEFSDLPIMTADEFLSGLV